MKELFTGLFLIILLTAFCTFIHIHESSNSILAVYSPTKIGIDTNNNQSIDSNEIFCTDNIESFSLEPDIEFYKKYSSKFNLNNTEMMSLGYLAQEFAYNTLQNKKVTIKNISKITSECRFATIKINGINYNNLLKNSGFGIRDEKIGSPSKFKANLSQAKNLQLVTLNHKSNKYHTLDCPYGNVAHDTVIIPKKQLPKSAKACKFCHQQINDLKNSDFKKDKNIKRIEDIPQPTLYTTDGNLKLFITDFTKNLKPNDKCTTTVCKELVSLISNTKKSIDIATYGYSNIPAITQALSDAKNRGVVIRFVYDSKYNDSENYYTDNQKIISLAKVSKSDKTEVKTQSNMLMHNKFIIFDNSTVFTGSMNLSPSGLSDYDVNSIVVINSQQIANLYLKEFEQMLNGEFHQSKEKLNTPNIFNTANNTIEVYFSPKDKPSNRIVELIKNAKSTIYIPAFLITHKDITNELIKAKQNGVEVRIIIDANSTNTRNTKHAILRQNGIPVKTENYAGKLHAKTIIIDDEYLIIGSMNFSNSGDNKNDENVLVIRNRKFAKVHKDFFLYLWTKIPNKYLKYNARSEAPESIGACSDGIDNNFNGKTDKDEETCK